MMYIFYFILSFLCVFHNIHAHYGFSSWGNFKYKKDFLHFDYVNPHAPKIGRVIIGGMGTFDSFNPYIVQGTSAANSVTPLTATLLEPAYDEINVSYAYLATGIAQSPDGLRVTFILNETANFSDGTPITAEDVKFSFYALVNQGLPVFKTYYQDVDHVNIDTPHKITFVLKHNKNKELPLLLGQIPVFSKKFYEKVPFDKSSLTPPPSSGPYEIVKVDPGQSITYKRRTNWWGADIPSQKGRYNFDTAELIYFRDTNALFEAFKSGKIHFRMENNAKLWHTAYNFDAVKNGRVIREDLKHQMSTGTQGFFFNTRRPLFQDMRVRQALTLLYNFEWINETLFYNAYKRNISYFPNSEFEGTGPLDEASQRILNEVGATYPDLKTAFKLPIYDDAHDQRSYATQALELLKQAGWTLKNNVLTHEKGETFAFEILIADKSIERTVSHYVQALKKIGIRAFIRFIDMSAYQERVEKLDFDMIMGIIPQSASPGGELYNYFGSKGADQRGTFNFAGIKNPKVDALIQRIVAAQSYDDLKDHVRALDRLLLSGYYMIPNWHSPTYHVARWHFIQHPDITPCYMPFAFDTWWRDDSIKPVPQENQNEQRTHVAHDAPSLWQRVVNFFRKYM